MGGLSDVVSGAGLTVWAEVALVLFFVVFLGVVVYVFSRRKSRWERARRLPLEDGPRGESSHD